MATIVEALKAKNPNATGSTIAEVLMSYNTLDEALAASDNYEGAGSAPLIIDKDLRKVNIPTNYVLGVYNDKDVLNVPFVLPRYYHGLDLSTFDIKINWQNAAGVKNYTEASDIVVGEDVVNFNWLLGAGVFTKAGSVNFVVCVRKATDKGLIEREFNTTTCSATVLEGLEAEDSSDPDQYSILVQMRGYAVDAEYYATQAENSMREAAAYVGSPLKAATAAAMTNTEKVYVYTGSESGYTNGNWYYYDGSAWVSGGVYNSTAVELDTELTSTTKAAQGKKVGDEISALKNDLNYQVNNNFWSYGEVVKAHILRAGYGDLKENPDYNTTDFIPVTPGEIIYGRGGRFCYYNDEKSFSGIQGILNTEANTLPYNSHYIIVPEGVSYFRISTNKTDVYFVAKLDTYSVLLQDSVSLLNESINYVQNTMNALVTKPYKYTTVEKSYIQTNSGNIIDNKENFLATDFVRIEGASKIEYTKLCVTATTPQHGTAFYDKDEAFIPDSGIPSVAYSPTNKYEVTIVDVPEGAVYARFTLHTGCETDFYVSAYPHNNIVEDVSIIKNDVSQIGKTIQEELYDSEFEYKLIESNLIRSNTGVMVGSDAFAATDFINIEGVSAITYSRLIVMVSAPTHGMAFYNENKEFIPNSGVPNLSGSEPGMELNTVDVPEGAVYARFTIWNAERRETIGTLHVYDVNKYGGGLKQKVINLESDVNVLKNGASILALRSEIPQSKAIQDVILRARQFTDVEWTPVNDMPGVYKNPTTGLYEYKTFKKGVRQKGIPYGSGLSATQMVGYFISFDAFISSVLNQNSLIYTNNAWSETAPKKATYYGIACSKLVQLCWGAPARYDSQNIYKLPGLVKIAEPGEYSVNDLKLGDGILNPVQHCTIVTDILRDYNGIIREIEISEAVSPTCCRLRYSVSEFYGRFKDYGLYRYEYIDNANYQKADYLDIDDGKLDINNLAIVPLRGTSINMPKASSYTANVINNKWVKFADVVDGIENIYDITSETIKLPNTRYGYHELYPIDANGNYGDPTKYFVYDSEVTHQIDNDEITVNYSVTNGATPFALAFDNYIYEYVDGTNEGSITTLIPSEVSRCYIIFKSEYGCFQSDYIRL